MRPRREDNTTTLPNDLVRYVNATFETSDRQEALLLLEHATIHNDTEASPRLKRCAAVGAGGTLKGLHEMIELLEIDWRDVIMCGEYTHLGNDEHKKVRDLSKPIRA
jgi:hypothetical protein